MVIIDNNTKSIFIFITSFIFLLTLHQFSSGQVVTLPNDSSRRDFKVENAVIYTDPSFFDLFNFPLAYGSVKETLNQPNTAVITQKLAKSYFDTEGAGRFRGTDPVALRQGIREIASTGVSDIGTDSLVGHVSLPAGIHVPDFH